MLGRAEDAACRDLHAQAAVRGIVQMAPAGRMRQCLAVRAEFVVAKVVEALHLVHFQNGDGVALYHAAGGIMTVVGLLLAELWKAPLGQRKAQPV